MSNINTLAEDLVALHEQIKFVMEKHKVEISKVEATTEPFDWTLEKDMQEAKGGIEEAISTYDLYAGSDILNGEFSPALGNCKADHVYETNRDMD